MAGEKVTTSADPMATINAMLTTLGGTKTTTSPGNTAALERVIADMRGQDPAAMLQSIFQQAGAQIPGIQSALSRSVGARTNRNSAVNAALQKLLASTTITAQDQLVKQQLAQMQAQVPAAQAIAQTTQGTTQTKGTDIGEASKNLAILQLLSKSGILEKLGLGDAAKSMTGAAPSQATGPMQSVTAPAAPAQITGEIASTQFPDLLMAASQGQAFTPTQFPDLIMPEVGGGAVSTPVTSQPSLDMFDLSSVTDMGPPQTAPVFYGDVIPGLEEYVLPVVQDYNEFYADGGLVGRDGKKAEMEPEDESEDLAEVKDQVKFDAGFTANAFMDNFRKLLGDSLGKSDNYADGGVITAPGARRSSSPMANLNSRSLTGALSGNALAAMLAATSAPTYATNKVSQPGVQPIVASRPTTTATIPEFDGGRGRDSIDTQTPIGEYGTQSLSDTFSPLSASTRSGIQTAAMVNALSGLTGGPSIPGFGLAAGLISAPTVGDAARIGLTAAGNAITPGLGSLAGFAMNPSLASGVNALSGLNPATAIANIGLSLTGNATLGEIVQNIADKANPNNPMSPTQTQAAADFAAGLSGGAVSPSTNLQGSGLTAQTGLYGDAAAAPAPTPAPVAPPALPPAPVITAVADKGDPFAGFTGVLGSGITASDKGGDAVGGLAGGDPPTPGDPGVPFADGGKIKGPGTGISDSIKINASKGEYVMSKDVVDTLGVHFFDALQAAFHTPAAVQKAMGRT